MWSASADLPARMKTAPGAASRASENRPDDRGDHGRVVKRTGDGAIVEFRSVVDAVRCEIEIQNAMVERNADNRRAARERACCVVNSPDQPDRREVAAIGKRGRITLPLGSHLLATWPPSKMPTPKKSKLRAILTSSQRTMKDAAKEKQSDHHESRRRDLAGAFIV